MIKDYHSWHGEKNGFDLFFSEKFHKNIQSKSYSRPKGSNITFYVDHYAGRVEYDAMGFLEKNRDRLPGDVVNMLRASENYVVKSLFQTHLTKTGNWAYMSYLPSWKYVREVIWLILPAIVRFAVQ
jgi:myosin heavy subunit